MSAAALRIGVLPKAPASSKWPLISKMAPILGTQHIHSHIVVCGSTMGVNYGWVDLIGMLTILLVRELFSKCDPLNEECPHTKTLPYIEGSSI